MGGGMTPRIRSARQRQIEANEATQYGCEHCHRRWNDEGVRPTKFTQRLATILAIAVIVACVVVIRHFAGWE